jgi:hypothetical protein
MRDELPSPMCFYVADSQRRTCACAGPRHAPAVVPAVCITSPPLEVASSVPTPCASSRASLVSGPCHAARWGHACARVAHNGSRARPRCAPSRSSAGSRTECLRRGRSCPRARSRVRPRAGATRAAPEAMRVGGVVPTPAVTPHLAEMKTGSASLFLWGARRDVRKKNVVERCAPGQSR